MTLLRSEGEILEAAFRSRIQVGSHSGEGQSQCAPRCAGTDPLVSTADSHMKKYAARVGNIYFLSHISPSLRWATEDTARDELPTKIKELLARLDQLEGGILSRNRRPSRGRDWLG
jgi:hypothetical protein